MTTLTRMLTISETIAEYGIPRKTLEVAIEKRELTAQKLQGKTQYIRRTDLEAWIDSKISNPPLLRAKHLKSVEIPSKHGTSLMIPKQRRGSHEKIA